MPKELLPIRLFHERTVDEQRIEGMSGETPKWVLDGEELTRHAAGLYAQLIDCADTDHNDALCYVVDVRLKDEATAKSRRKHVADLRRPVCRSSSSATPVAEKLKSARTARIGGELDSCSVGSSLHGRDGRRQTWPPGCSPRSGSTAPTR